ncbi:MAG: SDR family NAD(P)-dependent oxidoreductase [Rhizobacter sp.]|nr:SDR family NAD(P)-dependent oxidoreductase [Bacteriovorax sp.]
MRNESYLTSEKPLAVVASNFNMDGYDLAKQFAERGYDLILAASNPSVVEEAQDFKELGVDAVSFQLDLSTTEGVEQLYSRIIATGRPVEAMVINTGLSANFSNETSLAKKVLKDMALRGHGRILFAGSENQEDTTQVYETIFEEAKGSGVTVTAIKAGKNELYFLKEGYEEPYLLH